MADIAIKFAQKLAGNEKKFRDRAVRKLKAWISKKSKSNGEKMFSNP